MGYHQAENGAIALQAVSILMKKGLKLNLKKILFSMKNIKFPGRLEIIRKKNKNIILDIAHNFNGFKYFRKSIIKIYSNRKLYFIIGILDDKEKIKMLNKILDIGFYFVVTRPNNPRSKKYKSVYDFIKEKNKIVFLEVNIKKAIIKIIKKMTSKDLLCIIGSSYIIKEARKFLISN